MDFISTAPTPSILLRKFKKSRVFILKIRLLAFQPHPFTLAHSFPTVGTATPGHLPKTTRLDSLEVTRKGAALNLHTHQFKSPAQLPGAEELGRNRRPGGATSRPSRDSAPAAVAPRCAPSSAAPVALSGGAEWQENRPPGGAQLAAGKPGALRLTEIRPNPQRAPPRLQLLPGERVTDPVAPPLARLLRLPLGLRLLPGAGSRCLSRGAEGTLA